MLKRFMMVLAVLALPVAASAQQWNGAANTTGAISRTGFVGLGSPEVTIPVTPLEIAGSQTNSSGKFGSFEIQSYALNNAWLGENVYYNGANFARRTTGSGTLLYFFNGSFSIRTFGSGSGAVDPVQRFRIDSDGWVGLGGSQTSGALGGSALYIDPGSNFGMGALPNASYRLVVNGNANFTGTVSGNNIQAQYQDIAEWVPSTEDLAPGTVVILDSSAKNRVMASTKAYDSSVAGVVSAQPGITLGVKGADMESVATTGRVMVKVDAGTTGIAIGDLLVTSDKSGFAMKSEPIDINGRKFHQPGTIIGKALEPLAKGEGQILVLLSMQ